MDNDRARRRIELRVKPALRDRVDEGANVAQQDVPDFVREAVARHVERITGNQICRGCWEFFGRDEAGELETHTHKNREYKGDSE